MTVLITGGSLDIDAGIAGCELFNLSTGIWTITEKMHDTRAFHTASLLSNGKLLVTGGCDENDSTLASAELYDLLSKTWAITDTMQTERVYHTASVLSNENVLIAAGNNNDGFESSQTAELYNTSTENFTSSHSIKKINND